MNLQRLLQSRFEIAIAALGDFPPEVVAKSAAIRPTADASHGDYQCNAAMSLRSAMGQTPRQIAQSIVDAVDVEDWCEIPTIAGPGFINLKLKPAALARGLMDMLGAATLPAAKVDSPAKILIDFSSPNVAKPMHVGHIRSTVIGDALSRTYRAMGHQVLTDNHLGDWGTQFGMILYGYKHFGDPGKVRKNPVTELAALYREVHRLIGYHEAVQSIQTHPERLQAAMQAEREATAMLAAAENDGDSNKKEIKKLQKRVGSAQARVKTVESELVKTQESIDEVRSDASLGPIADQHSDIAAAVLRETAALHQGDEENRRLWNEFLPHCRDEIDRVYARLGVTFDMTLGESHYHDQLPGVIETLRQAGRLQTSDGAGCVFIDGYESPMIVQKSDGAFLYATTDLATLRSRVDSFAPDEILYVVDSRQSEHFEKLFALADLFGARDVRLAHVSFGTVLGGDGRPMKTRSGSLIGLESLLDDAVAKAHAVVCEPERLAKHDPPMDPAEAAAVAEAVGIGAVKYADLSHHRTSDYKFDLDKMVALEGNTSTVIQYSHARTSSILRRYEQQRVDSGTGRSLSEVCGAMQAEAIVLEDPAEMALALQLTRLEEALVAVRDADAPNHLCDYLYQTARTYSVFNDTCRVLGGTDESVMHTRLLLVYLTGKVLETGLGCLGIPVVPRM